MKMTDPFSTGGGSNVPLHEFENHFISADVWPGAVGRELECSAGPVAMVRFLFARRSKLRGACIK